MFTSGRRVGRYVLESLLGRGGAGEVWSARDTDLGRRVALKFLRGGDATELARFEREARAAGRLAHPGIAAVYEVGSFEGVPFIAMQLADGGTLRSRGGDAREAVRCVRDAARALQHAHDAGVVHRDLKPDNLLADREGRVLVSDFGLARVAASGSTLTAQGAVLGTPAYMSPEQARGEIDQVDARSDVYGLGATLHHLLAGTPPFSGASTWEIITSVVSDPPPVLPGDRALAAIVMKCLEKDPARRYRTMMALADELDRWLAGGQVSATLPTRLGRKRWALASVAMALMVAASAAALVWRARGTGRPDPALTISSLRQRADACLKAALDLRRSGNLAGMEKYARELREACAAFGAADPANAEPHYLRGRMLRAQLQFAAAEREQEEALRRDPRHPRARYERLLIRAHAVRQGLDDLAAEERRRLDASQGGEPVAARIPEPLVKLRDAVAAEASALGEDVQLEPGERHGARALGAWAELRPREAKEAAEAAIGAEGDLDEAYQILGDSELELQRLEACIDAYAAGVARDPGALRLRYSLAKARYDRARLESGPASERMLEAVEEELTGLLAIDVSARDAMRLRADATTERALRMSARDAEAAAAASRLAVSRHGEALQLAPDDVSLLAGLGLAQSNEALRSMKCGHDPTQGFDGAIETLTKAVAKDASYAAAWNGRGVARLNYAAWLAERGEKVRERFDDAAGDFSRALELDPRDARFLAWRARARMNAGNLSDDYARYFAEALEDVAKVRMRRHSTMGRIHYNWGRRDAKAGKDPSPRYRDALAALDEAVRVEGGDEPVFTRGLVKLAMATGPSREALLVSAADDFTAAVKESPGHAEAFASRGRVKADLASDRGARGQDAEPLFRDAVADGRESVRLNGRRAESWNVLGASYRAWGVWAVRHQRDPRDPFIEALGAFDRSLELRPDDAVTHTNRASTRHALGHYRRSRGERPRDDFAAALKDYERAVALDGSLEPRLRSPIATCRRDLEGAQ